MLLILNIICTRHYVLVDNSLQSSTAKHGRKNCHHVTMH